MNYSNLVACGRAGALHIHDNHEVFDKMADRIEELEAALRDISSPIYGSGSIDSMYEEITREANRRQKLARAALDGTPDERDVANVPADEWQTDS